MVSFACPVRGCGEALRRDDRQLACPRGHRFDLARSGYCNLLQPQDKRSRQPGDSAAAVAARRRLFDGGHGDWLLPHLRRALDELRLPEAAAVLDIGCGEGFYLGTLAAERGYEAHGFDLATDAVDLAARRYPGATWAVANADRFLPYVTGSFELALAITSRLNPPEIHRVLKRGSAPGESGRLLIAVPGPDDLVELRAAVLGAGPLRDRLQPAIASLEGDFELLWQARARTTLRLDGGAVRDLLAATYRGARGSQQERSAALAAQEVTMSRDLACLRPRAREG